jgi:hypothetical protein
MSYNTNEAAFTRTVTDNSTPVHITETYKDSTTSGFNNMTNTNTNTGAFSDTTPNTNFSSTGTTGFNNLSNTGATGFNNLSNTGATGYNDNFSNTGSTGLSNNTFSSQPTSATSSMPLAAESFKNSIFQVGPAGAPNIISSLERDHAEFRRLYNDFVRSGSMKEREEIKNELVRGLSIHDFITETILYPALLKEVPHGPEMVSPFRTKMTDFRKMLMAVDKTKLDDPTFLPTFHTLFQELDTSMKSKELELLPALRALGPHRVEALGKALDKARSGAPTRPHTSAASSNVLGHLAAPIDKLKDKGRDFVGASSETRDVLGK